MSPFCPIKLFFPNANESSLCCMRKKLGETCLMTIADTASIRHILLHDVSWPSKAFHDCGRLGEGKWFEIKHKTPRHEQTGNYYRHVSKDSSLPPVTVQCSGSADFGAVIPFGARFTEPYCGEGSLEAFRQMEPRAKAGEHRNLMDDPLAVVKPRTLRWIGCGSKAYPLPISRVHYVVSNLRLSTSVSVWLSDYSDRWMIAGLGQVFFCSFKGFYRLFTTRP